MSTSGAVSTTTDDPVGPRNERDLRRFEAYCRWSLHILILAGGVVLAVAGAIVGGGPSTDGSPVSVAGLVVAAALAVAWTGLAVTVTELVCREIPVPRPVVIAFALCGLTVTFGFGTLIPRDANWSLGTGPYVGAGPVGLAGTASVAALTKQWRPVAVGAAAAVVLLVLVYRFGPPAMPVGAAMALGVMAGWFTVFCVPAALVTRWMIDVVRRLWQSRQVAADLAVAEERLRFSRDLHDVFGRTLSTVAVKSELAAELARRGDMRAVDEMTAVRELAQSAVTDVRGLVRGYRRVDLVDEVAGARSVLRAAGIAVQLEGVDDIDQLAARLPSATAEALAWVVREGVTNVLRHGHGGEVRLSFRESDDRVEVSIENPLARAWETTPGSGLVGLRERLEAVGGDLHAGPSASGFALVASVPFRAH